MEVVHVGDQAGVACILAKYQVRRGIHSSVLVSSIDKFGIYRFYRPYVTNVRDPGEFIDFCLNNAKGADVIHVHSRIDLVKMFRKRFGRSIKIILHYHGTDLRGIRKYVLPHRSFASDLAIRALITARRVKAMATLKRQHAMAQELSDLVIVATPDLLELVSKNDSYCSYLDNPIDVSHFRPEGGVNIDIESRHQYELRRGRALTFNTESSDIELTRNKFASALLPMELEVYDRTISPIMYEEMPNFIRRFKTYVDIRYIDGKLLHNLSKTALEALACGLEVIDFDLRSHSKLPPQHDPENVVKVLDELYFKS